MSGFKQGGERRGLIVATSVLAVALGAGAAGVGTTSDAVLRWATPPASVQGITVVDSATDGTSFVLGLPGLYTCELYLAQVASSSLRGGVSVNGVLPILAAVNPTFGVSGIVAGGALQTLAAATFASYVVTTQVQVTRATMGAVTVRGVANVAAGTTPIPSLTVAECYFRITRGVDAAG